MATDRAFGLVVDALVDAGMLGDATDGAKRAEANGVLVVHSDNGGFPCAQKLAGSNHPYRGCKFNWFEGGIKVPAFIYGPGVVPETREGATYAGLMHHADWTATPQARGRADGRRRRARARREGPLVGHRERHGRPHGPHDRVLARADVRGAAPGAAQAAAERRERDVVLAEYDAVALATSGDQFAAIRCDGTLADNAPSLLFNVVDDPHERTLLSTKSEYTATIQDLEFLAMNIYSNQKVDVTYPHGAPQDGVDAVTAFDDNGGASCRGAARPVKRARRRARGPSASRRAARLVCVARARAADPACSCTALTRIRRRARRA